MVKALNSIRRKFQAFTRARDGFTLRIFRRCPDASLEAGIDCEENCNNQRQVCLGPCLDLSGAIPEFDTDCLDACTSTHLQCMRTCPCVTVGDCPFGCPCPSFSCDPTCEVEVDIEPAQES